MAAPGQAWVNGRDLAGFGLTVANVAGTRDWAATAPSDAHLGRAGVLRTGADRTEAARSLTLTGIIDGVTAAAITTNVRNLIAWCGRGIVELTLAADPLVKYYVELRGSQLPPPTGGQWIARWNQVTLTFAALSPRGVFRCELPYRLTTARTAIPLGSAISAPLIRAWSYTSPLVVTTRDAAGRVVNTFTVAYTLGSGNDSVVIDCHERTIYRASAGVLVLGQDLIKGEFPILDPRHGQPEAGLWPTVDLSTGVGELIVRALHLVD